MTESFLPLLPALVVHAGVSFRTTVSSTCCNAVQKKLPSRRFLHQREPEQTYDFEWHVVVRFVLDCKEEFHCKFEIAGQIGNIEYESSV